MKRETIERSIWIFCIVVLLLLSAKIRVESKNYSCEECIANLSSVRAGMSGPLGYSEVVISEAFEELKEGRCMVSWSPTQGYIRGT